jgi:hypothetical protein
MTRISDETLMAYLDNELPADERARVNAALVLDSALQARLRRQERVRELLSEAFDPAVHQSVPKRLVEAAMRTPIPMQWHVRRALALPFGGASFGDVVRAWAPLLAPAMATLVIGLAIGFFAGSGGSGGLAQAGLIAEGELARALERQLASDDVRSGPRVAVSFRARDGRLCRSFDMGAAHDNLAGVACRSESAWSIVALSAAEPRRGAYELAGSGMPDVVRQSVTQMMAGEALNAEAEQRARDAGWR